MAAGAALAGLHRLDLSRVSTDDHLVRSDDQKSALAKVDAEIRKLIELMQTRESQIGTDALFLATPEQLGQSGHEYRAGGGNRTR
jgi:hypothetical protein